MPQNEPTPAPDDQPKAEAPAPTAPAAEQAAPADDERYVGDPNRYTDVEATVSKGVAKATVGEFAGSITEVRTKKADGSLSDPLDFTAAEHEGSVGIADVEATGVSPGEGTATLRLTIPAD